LEYLLERFKNFNLEEKDELGNSVLSMAVQGGSFEIAELLLKKGAEVNTVNL
jgi:ankyrin repeat protein